jgi:hypothetical protein
MVRANELVALIPLDFGETTYISPLETDAPRSRPRRSQKARRTDSSIRVCR